MTESTPEFRFRFGGGPVGVHTPAESPAHQVVLVFDPRLVSNELVEAIVAERNRGFRYTIRGGQGSEKDDSFWDDGLEFRTHSCDSSDADPHWCFRCNSPILYQGLGLFWYGLPMCDNCAPELWRTSVHGAYTTVKRWIGVDDFELDYGGFPLDLWEEAIYLFLTDC